MKKKYIVQIIIVLLFAFLIMCIRGLFENSGVADKIMAISDGFTVASFLYLGMGALIRVSEKGLFDIFGFALKQGIHVFFPNKFQEGERGFYEYKVKRNEQRKPFSDYFSLFIGFVFLMIGFVMTFIWYQI
uniref:DUF3899 domain-containing protein n=1 Tax=Agathobacter sp. TaxID=2021311 RepID=UPI0040566145